MARGHSRVAEGCETAVKTRSTGRVAVFARLVDRDLRSADLTLTRKNKTNNRARS